MNYLKINDYETLKKQNKELREALKHSQNECGQIKNLCSELELRNQTLIDFARKVIRVEAWHIEESDGADIQTHAEDMGLIKSFEVKEEHLETKFADPSVFNEGDLAYKFSKFLSK